jgi:hypothetical protein
MKGERSLIHNGYVWDVFAYFPCNASGVRVATRKTSYGACRFAARFSKLNHVETSAVWRHDPLLDEKMNRSPRTNAAESRR